MRVREARIQDLPQIVILAKELLEQSPPYAGIEMNEVKFKRSASMVMASKLGAAFVIADDNDIAQGFIMGHADDLFFADGRCVTDMAIYARESARSYGGFMVRRFVKWARTIAGVKMIPMAISSGMGDIDRVGAMYEALGGVRAGGLYFMRVEK